MASSPAAPLRRQLFVALVVPAVLAIGAVAWVADIAARRALEAALASRLCAVAQAAATRMSPRVLLLDRGDDDTRLAKNARAKLEELAQATSVARVFLVAAEDARILADTADGAEVGEEYVRARFDRAELRRVLAGEATASVLFTGPDGRPYKTGYAPLSNEAGRVVAYTGVAAPADYTAAVDELRATMAAAAVAGLALLVLAAVWSARRVSVPLSALSDAAQRIGAGDLDTTIPSGGPREAEILAETMRGMTASLRAREQQMQMMLAGIAHEVRNPLGGIELFGGLLDEDLEGDPRQKHVHKILRELRTLSKVVNDFLDYARHKAPEPRRLPLFELAFEVISVAERDAGERGVTLDLDVDRDLEATVDPERMRRALLNLVRNAVQAAPAEAGRVVLWARVQGGRLLVGVDDDGPGVPEGAAEEIFAPFFTTKQKGTGLGLALVRKAAEEHGGEVTVGRSDLGGARFTLSLPAPAS